MREVYSPYNITVTDARPAGTSYHLAIVAGLPQDIGLSSDILGVAPLATGLQRAGQRHLVLVRERAPADRHSGRVNNLCWTAAQESAHAFGLDHQYEYVADKRSACNDLMTYRADRRRAAVLPQPERELRRVPDPAVPLRRHPELAPEAPLGVRRGAVADPGAVGGDHHAPGDRHEARHVGRRSAGSRRGVSAAELWVNGLEWAEARGAAFGPGGQPNPSPYGIQVPASLPSSVVDIQVRAYDDIGLYTESAPRTSRTARRASPPTPARRARSASRAGAFWIRRPARSATSAPTRSSASRASAAAPRRADLHAGLRPRRRGQLPVGLCVRADRAGPRHLLLPRRQRLLQHRRRRRRRAVGCPDRASRR